MAILKTKLWLPHNIQYYIQYPDGVKIERLTMDRRVDKEAILHIYSRILLSHKKEQFFHQF